MYSYSKLVLFFIRKTEVCFPAMYVIKINTFAVKIEFDAYTVKPRKKNILVCSATLQEIQPLIQWLKKHFLIQKKSLHHFVAAVADYQIEIVITGAGMTNTAYYLGKLYNEPVFFAINAGIAGAFDTNLKMGQAVIVSEEIFSELGAESGNNFLSLSNLKLGDEKIIPNKLYIPDFFSRLKKVRGITVNKVHGKNSSIKEVCKLFKPQIESMEGGAFYFACGQNKWKCMEIRTISNYVEKRNKNKWDIPLAVQNLNQMLIQYIQIL